MGNKPVHKVLVVDDEKSNISILVEALGDDYEISVATSGEDALVNVNQESPDLVLLDILMPGIDGYEVCRQIKKSSKTKGTVIIFTTALSEVGDETKGLLLGAEDYITKPINPAIVRARVKTQLALHDQKQFLEQTVRQRTNEIYQTRLSIVQRLGVAAEYKDKETGEHVVRMAHYAAKLAEKSGLSESEVEMIFNAAPLHDVGKIGIPDQILQKPGKLTDAEWKIMKKHPEIGANIIGGANNELMRNARVISWTHHEKWDGTGYPKALKGDSIPIYGRIVALADVFDALTNDRPYKEAWPIEAAFSLLEDGSGIHFDPKLVTAFLSIKSQILEIKNGYSS